ncbi:hypothetical protein Ct9H90mP29_03360 [bacterium]|nr:MAG: hypothetical protein Ct9H90mP29_03360 [bacterium]
MVNITIYDIMGRTIRTLVKSRQTAGYRSTNGMPPIIKVKGISWNVFLYYSCRDFSRPKDGIIKVEQ